MSGGEKRQNQRARAGPHFRSGGGQEAEEGNFAAFKKVVVEKELFEGVGWGTWRGVLLRTSRVSTNLGLSRLNSSVLFY